MTWSVHTHTGEPRGQESASPQGSPELRLQVATRAGFQLVPEAPADGGDRQKVDSKSSHGSRASEVSVVKGLEEVLSVLLGIYEIYILLLMK